MDRIARNHRAALQAAEDYTTWREIAAELDRREGLDDWKADEVSDDYDWRLIRSRLRQLRELHAAGDVAELVHHLRQGLHWNLGNIGNPALYAKSRVGTKHLIQEYIAEVVAIIDYLCDTEFDEFPFAEKIRFFSELSKSYGRSALMLSGGATLGLFHVGVLKALYQQDLLPDVISGSSAGSVVAATVGTRRPDELEALMDPKNAYYHFWKPLGLKRIIEQRSLMDPAQVAKAIAANVRDLTFEESFRISGKVVNITVSPAGGNQPPRLLNYLTFPYLFLREATLASCSVPFLFPPVMLMSRDAKGDRVPFMPMLKWNDGSLKSDLPMLRLRRLHNVNHFVVSQTNPHVIPFLGRRMGETRGLAGALREYAFESVRSQARHALDFARRTLPVGGVRSHVENIGSILEQDYRGHVTILPERSLWRFARVTANPNLPDIERFIREGERSTWARMSMVRNQVAIGQALDRCVARLERRQVGGPGRESRHGPLAVVRSNSA